MSEILQAIDHLAKSYHDGTRELRVLRDVNLDVRSGEAIAIVGMSGAGKSTLLHLLGGLDRPDKGAIRFRGEDMSAWPRRRLDEYRNRSIGFVFQFHHLLPEFNAMENIMIPALVARRPKHEARDKALDLLKQLGLQDRATHRPSRLSGGEQQRVALGRALVNDPALLLADEPTGNLDLKTGERVIELIWKVTVKKGRSLVIVTHEPSIAERADRIFHLENGRLDPVTHEDYGKRLAHARD